MIIIMNVMIIQSSITIQNKTFEETPGISVFNVIVILIITNDSNNNNDTSA